MALRVFKTLKDYINYWGKMDDLKRATYEQIASIYGTIGKHNVEITYLKRALRLCIVRRNTATELQLYDKLSLAYMNVGNVEKMGLYHHRHINELSEPVGGKDYRQIVAEFRVQSKRKKKVTGSAQMARTGAEVENIDKLETHDYCYYEPLPVDGAKRKNPEAMRKEQRQEVQQSRVKQKIKMQSLTAKEQKRI